nr:endonuclease MutS2 [Thomasclavelia cocleata]
MKNTYDTLEFNQIKNKVEAFCISSLAKDKIETLQPYQDLEDLKLDQKYLDQAMCLIYKYGRLPMGYYNDVEPLLLKANKDGTLFGEDFVQIVYLLNNVKEIINYLSDKEIKENELVNLCNQFILPKQLLKEINRCIDSSGNVLDNASKELRRIRRQILSIEANIRTKIEQVKAANKDYLSQEAISSRNNHLVLPVKAGNKNIVKGIVHAVSATGQTMFIEPEIIVSMNNQLVHARDDELREINRILTELSRMVKDNYDLLHENQELMVEIDVIFAKAGYGVQIDGVVPDVCEDYSSFSLIKARHPLIDKDKVVANSIILNEPKRMLLISGSNTGGKTVVLKTAGLLSLMALCGMAVPCNQAVVPMFDQICVDLGDEQSIEQSLSTFSSHMKRLVEITNDVSEKSLVLLDEIGSGTDPKEGQSIAEAILRYLHKVNPLIVASTHYSGLKEFAKNEEYILVAAVEFDQERMIPTYRLIEGSVGNSYAIEISSRLGLKEEIVELAYQIKENSLTDSDKLLEKLQDELTQVQIERDNLELLTNEAKNKMNRYERLINNFEKQKDELIENAKQQANQLLEDSKQEIDLVVEELKKQAELKQHVVIEAKRNLDLLKHEEKKIINEEKHAYQIGDIVKVLSANRQGEILSINKKGILTISMSGLKTRRSYFCF